MSNPRIPFHLGPPARPLPPPAPGKRLIAFVVLNVEHWRFDRPMPRKVLGAPHGVEHTPDVPNFSWVEYGMRRGLPRIVSSLKELALPVSISFNASVIEAYPAAAEMLASTGWEFIGHGLHQQSLHGAKDERAVIEGCLTAVEALTGSQPRGWLGPGLQETDQTPDVLSDLGIEYVCDWVVDEVPVWLQARPKPLVALPYSLELNDSVVYAVERQSSPEVHRRLLDTLRVFDSAAEAEEVKVVALPLHPHLLGVPHRFLYLQEMLEVLMARDDVMFMSGSDICHWFQAAG